MTKVEIATCYRADKEYGLIQMYENKTIKDRDGKWTHAAARRLHFM